ncbi:MAG: Gfo/Idh/MocA family oxidoreductase [Myxococcales bacterium]|nr:MAG: Gfo/Idh/MocA family oxidoreductase [Myxococcales bacterium]
MTDSSDRDPSRRVFVQGTLLAAAAATLSGAACSRKRESAKVAAESPSTPKLGWAIVGLGKFATEQLLPAFQHCQRSRLAAFVSGSPDKAKRLAGRYGVDEKAVYGYETFDKLAQDRSVDVVYVVLPNSMHAEYTQRAFRAGKHVMCEKPMALNEAECSAMIAAGKAAGKRLMIAYRAQFEPHNRAAIELVRAGELGRVKLVIADHCRTIDPKEPADQWRIRRAMSGGGSLVDIGIYSLQAARYIFGEEPTEVSAQLASTPNDPRFMEVEESAVFSLRFPNGGLANCSSSYGTTNVKRYRVIGEKGYADLDPATSYEGNVLRVAKDGKPEPREVPTTNQFAAEIDHLSECIQLGKEPRTPGEEGLRDVRIMQAIYASAREGKAVKLA